jgi:hypothetical protein
MNSLGCVKVRLGLPPPFRSGWRYGSCTKYGWSLLSPLLVVMAYGVGWVMALVDCWDGFLRAHEICTDCGFVIVEALTMA